MLLLVVSAAAAAWALRFAWYQPLGALLGLSFCLALWAPRYIARRRLRKLLRSGDVGQVLDGWEDSLKKVPHAETMRPLMMATALAAHGWIERARAVLKTVERGPAWEAAIEHRLFLDTLLLTFEGQADEAITRAQRLQRLPVPNQPPFGAGRIETLRDGIAALARAFSHASETGDDAKLLAASETSPLVFWAMRYGAAIVAMDQEREADAAALIETAPSWPEESCFQLFHRELHDELLLRKTGKASRTA